MPLNELAILQTETNPVVSFHSAIFLRGIFEPQDKKEEPEIKENMNKKQKTGIVISKCVDRKFPGNKMYYIVAGLGGKQSYLPGGQIWHTFFPDIYRRGQCCIYGSCKTEAWDLAHVSTLDGAIVYKLA